MLSLRQEPKGPGAEPEPENMGSHSLLDSLLKAERSVPRPKPPPPIPPLAKGELYDLSCRLLARPDVLTSEALGIIALLLTGAWSASGLPALRALAGDAAKNGVCSCVWNPGELIVKCRTCQMDPFCAICVHCFRHGDHTGHDYTMIESGGGCCDCGDDQAWKPSGFCPHHSGASGEDDDPAELMSPRLRIALVEAIEAVSSEILSNCERFHKILLAEAALEDAPLESACSKEGVEHVSLCLAWLEQIVKCGDGIRRVIGEHLKNPGTTSWLSCMLSLDGVDRLPRAVCKALHSLYFQLITDPVFKRAFLEMYVVNYPRFVHSLIVRRLEEGIFPQDDVAGEDDIFQFSVQLFTIPALVPVMLREGGLLDVLMNMILRILETASMPVLPYVDVGIGESQFELSRLKKNRAGTVEESSRMNSGSKKLPFGALPLPDWVFTSPRDPKQSDCMSSDSSMFGIEQSSTSSSAEDTLNVPTLTRSCLPSIKYVQAVVAEDMLKQLEVLQQIMFENGFDNLISAKSGVCPLLSQDFGKWYRSAIADAKQRSLLAASDSGNITHTMRVEWLQSSIMNGAFYRVLHDLQYVLIHSEISIHFVHHRPDLFRMFVRMLSMIQGMFPVRRRFGNNMLVESETWAKAFTVEIEFFRLFQHLIVAYCRDPNPQTLADVGPSADTRKNVHLSPAQSRARLLRITRQALDEWVEREKGLEKMSILQGEEFSVAHSVSIHLPLHRLLSMLGHHSVRLDGVSPSFALSGSNAGTTPEEAMELLRHPLRIQAYLAQVRAGMWRRNGRVVRGQTILYRAKVCAEWFADMDLFLHQTCAIVAGGRRFVSTTLSAFQILSFSDFIRLSDSLKALSTVGISIGNTSLVSAIPVARSEFERLLGPAFGTLDASTRHALRATWVRTSLGNDAFIGTYLANLALAEYAPSLVESVIAFLVRVSAERARCGFNDRQYLRHKLVHEIACGDYTHSELLRNCPCRIQQPQPEGETNTSPLTTDDEKVVISGMVDVILNEIAHFEEPHDMEQGGYRLKDSVWSDFDRFTKQVSDPRRRTAEDRYLAACVRRECRPLPFQELPIANLPLYPSYKPLRGLPIWLCSQSSESLVKVILQKCLQNEGGLQSLDDAILGALYLACMAVEYVSPRNSGCQGVVVQPNLLTTWLLNQLQGSSGSGATCLDYIAEMYCLSMEPQDQEAPLQYVQPGLERILIQAHARGDSQLRQRLSSKVPLLFGGTNPAGAL